MLPRRLGIRVLTFAGSTYPQFQLHLSVKCQFFNYRQSVSQSAVKMTDIQLSITSVSS